MDYYAEIEQAWEKTGLAETKGVACEIILQEVQGRVAFRLTAQDPERLTNFFVTKSQARAEADLPGFIKKQFKKHLGLLGPLESEPVPEPAAA